MNENEFVKSWGLKEAKELLKNGEGWCSIGGYVFHTDDLKRLVESHELVRIYGGIDVAIYIRNHNMLLPEFMPELKQAIADVESCQ